MLLETQSLMRWSLPPRAYESPVIPCFSIFLSTEILTRAKVAGDNKAVAARESWSHRWHFLPFALRTWACREVARALRIIFSPRSPVHTSSHRLARWCQSLAGEQHWPRLSPQFLITICSPKCPALDSLQGSLPRPGTVKITQGKCSTTHTSLVCNTHPSTTSPISVLKMK